MLVRNIREDHQPHFQQWWFVSDGERRAYASVWRGHLHVGIDEDRGEKICTVSALDERIGPASEDWKTDEDTIVRILRTREVAEETIAKLADLAIADPHEWSVKNRPTFAWPVVAHKRITSPFGPRLHPISGVAGKTHHGIDIAGHANSAITASCDGTVIFRGWKVDYGLSVEIEHAHGFSTFYAHCGMLAVQNDQKVQRGTPIATVGSTGASTGPHLHFELHRNELPVDPLPYLPANGS